MLAAGRRGIFTIEHFDGYAAVLIQLKTVGSPRAARRDRRRLARGRTAGPRGRVRGLGRVEAPLRGAYTRNRRCGTRPDEQDTRHNRAGSRNSASGEHEGIRPSAIRREAGPMVSRKEAPMVRSGFHRRGVALVTALLLALGAGAVVAAGAGAQSAVCSSRSGACRGSCSSCSASS